MSDTKPFYPMKSKKDITVKDTGESLLIYKSSTEESLEISNDSVFSLLLDIVKATNYDPMILHACETAIKESRVKTPSSKH